LQEISIPGITKKEDNAVDEDEVEAHHNEHGEKDDSVKEDSEAGKQNARDAAKTASANAKKRRSGRRR
jgi:hypothetical protein